MISAFVWLIGSYYRLVYGIAWYGFAALLVWFGFAAIYSGIVGDTGDVLTIHGTPAGPITASLIGLALILIGLGLAARPFGIRRLFAKSDPPSDAGYIIAAFALLLYAAPAWADVVKYTDASGVTHYVSSIEQVAPGAPAQVSPMPASPPLRLATRRRTRRGSRTR